MSGFLEWVKSNVFIVVFCVIMIAAPVGMWFFTSSLNSGVKAEVQKRAGNMTPLASLKKVSIEIPGQAPQQGVINDQFIVEYTKFANALGKDAEAVRAAAIEHNRKGRDVLRKDVFPAMAPDMRQTLPSNFHESLTLAYASLLAEVGGGSPPSLESLRDDLTRTRNAFITQKLQKRVEDPLTEKDLEDLRKHLAERRLALYTASAENVNIYVTRDSIMTAAPLEWDRLDPTPAQLFQWQWEYWVISDVLRALHEANKTDQKVYRAPVKQVVFISAAVPGGSGTSRPNDSRGLRPPGGGGGTGMTLGGGGEDEAGAAPPAVTGTSSDPKMQIPFDYSASITGRKSNPLYDVINVDLDLIVETERLPQVIDALSKYNFITVSALNLSHGDPSADPFNAAREGYVYGGAPVSLVRMRLETIWLRDWVTPFMPDDLKKALNIPIPPKPGAPGTPGADPPPEES